VIVIAETRYSGIYEGGPWAGFLVTGPGGAPQLPEDAFGGDPAAVDWWWEPTVPVGVGDSPEEALGRLRQLLERDAAKSEDGYFSDGAQVRVADCAPSDYDLGLDRRGTVISSEFVRTSPSSGGLRGWCVCTVRGSNSMTVRIPERYLRTVDASPSSPAPGE
jgi:hypothetical protein